MRTAIAPACCACRALVVYLQAPLRNGERAGEAIPLDRAATVLRSARCSL